MSRGMQIVLGSSGLGVLLVFLGVPWCSLGVHFGNRTWRVWRLGDQIPQKQTEETVADDTASDGGLQAVE